MKAMRLKFKREDPDPISDDILAVQIEDIRKRIEYYQLSIRVLLGFIKDFSLDLKEINSDDFKHNIRCLTDFMQNEIKLKKIRKRFEKDQKNIAAYIDRHRLYLNDRESELKDIIEILTNAMVTLDTENQRYNQKILQQSEKIEKITLLVKIF